MKNSKIIALALFVLTTTFSIAQKNKTPEKRAEILTEKMKSELLLSDDQVQKIAEINLDIALKNNQIKSDESMDLEAKKIALKESRKVRVAKLKDVLTVSQFEKMKKMKKEKRAHKSIKKNKEEKAE